jgi:hypothetical protein
MRNQITVRCYGCGKTEKVDRTTLKFFFPEMKGYCSDMGMQTPFTTRAKLDFTPRVYTERDQFIMAYYRKRGL